MTAGFLGESIGIIQILALQGGGYVVAGADGAAADRLDRGPRSTETPGSLRPRTGDHLGPSRTRRAVDIDRRVPGAASDDDGAGVPRRRGWTRGGPRPAGTRRKSPGPPSTTSAPSGPDSIRIRPLTTYSVVSCSPWWCQPDTEPGSVSTTPVHMPASCIARLRAMPGVGSDGVSSSAPMRATGVAGSFVMRSSNRDSRVSASGPRLLRSGLPMPEEGHSWHRS